MDVLLKGIMLYRRQKRDEMAKQFREVKNNPTKAVFFTCIDTRLIPAKFLNIDVGDMYTVRNAGCMVPHSKHFREDYATNEPGAIELGCVIHDIKHIVICGHGDCKAIQLLHKLQDAKLASKENRQKSPLKAWVYTHGYPSLEKFINVKDFSKPVTFQSNVEKIEAFIDPDNKFNALDKLSQINTLQQLINVASYDMLRERLENHEVQIHALWFEFPTGDIYYFSRVAKRFVLICEENLQNLLDETDLCNMI